MISYFKSLLFMNGKKKRGKNAFNLHSLSMLALTLKAFSTS